MQIDDLINLSCGEAYWDDRLFVAALEISFCLLDHVFEKLDFFRSANDGLNASS